MGYLTTCLYLYVVIGTLTAVFTLYWNHQYRKTFVNITSREAIYDALFGFCLWPLMYYRYLKDQNNG